MEQQNEEEKDVSESETIDFSKPNFIFVPQGNHDWRQRGPYIVCVSCEIEHASWIGMEKMLVGIDKESQPIFKNKKDLA